MADAMPATVRRNAWPMVMRTKSIDDLVVDAVVAGVDRVVNLAAGFDMRPYRLALPAGLTWVEADLPELMAEKEQAIRHDRARCRVRREAVDLADDAARRAFLDRAVDGASKVAVITEGLLIYLQGNAVRGLASDLALRSGIRVWISDLAGPVVLRMLQRQLGPILPSDARLRFAPETGVAFFEPFGWKAAEVRSLFEDAARTRRLPLLLRPFVLLPAPSPTRPGRRPWSAVVRFVRDLDS